MLALRRFNACYCFMLPGRKSFPLYRRRRLAGYVVRNAIDAAYFINDA